MKNIFKPWRKLKNNLSVLKPEEYWINRGDNVIGNLTKDEMLNKNRQLDTYRIIYNLILKLSIRQVADLGCNVSILGVMLREQGYKNEYIGIDSNSHALKIAKNNHSSYSEPHKFYEANLRRLEFPDQTFEIVVLKDVLEHLEDFREVLSEALRVTQKYAIVSNFIPWTEGNTLVRKEPAGYFHNMYARREVYQFIDEAGFNVVSTTSALESDARPNEVVLLQRKV